MSDSSPAGTTKGRSRLVLVLVIAFFAAPVVFAWLAFYVFPDWRPSGTINSGNLVQPVRPLPDFRLAAIDGRAIDQTLFRGKWTLLVMATGECKTNCVRRLYNIRQIRLAQGKNIDRLQRLIFWDRSGLAPGSDATMQTDFPGLLIVPVSRKSDSELISRFVLGRDDPLTAGYLYLVDPLGNLMMQYDPEVDPRAVIEDLERLLKYSGLG